MQQWEYCAVGPVQSHSQPHYATVIRFTNEGRRLSKIQGTRDMDSAQVLAQIIAQLGEEGWEMVGCGMISDERHMLYFKRPKSPSLE